MSGDIDRRVEGNAHPWSGVVERSGVNLLVPWLDSEHREAGSLWIQEDRAAELAAALLAEIKSTPEFTTEMMRQALFPVVAAEHVDEAARRTGRAAEILIEHAVALVSQRGVTPQKKRRARPNGVTNVIPGGEHEGIL